MVDRSRIEAGEHEHGQNRPHPERYTPVNSSSLISQDEIDQRLWYHLALLFGDDDHAKIRAFFTALREREERRDRWAKRAGRAWWLVFGSVFAVLFQSYSPVIGQWLTDLFKHHGK